jgi:hypothetical protein
MQPPITWNDVPAILTELKRDIDFIRAQFQKENDPEEDKLMTIEQLRDYLPEHPARQTCYQWVNNRLIDYEKHGNRLYFRKSSIDYWLANGRRNKVPQPELRRRRVL